MCTPCRMRSCPQHTPPLLPQAGGTRMFFWTVPAATKVSDLAVYSASRGPLLWSGPGPPFPGIRSYAEDYRYRLRPSFQGGRPAMSLSRQASRAAFPNIVAPVSAVLALSVFAFVEPAPAQTTVTVSPTTASVQVPGGVQRFTATVTTTNATFHSRQPECVEKPSRTLLRLTCLSGCSAG